MCFITQQCTKLSTGKAIFKNESLQEIKVVGGIDSITPDSGSQNSCDIIVKIVGKGLKTILYTKQDLLLHKEKNTLKKHSLYDEIKIK